MRDPGLVLLFVLLAQIKARQAGAKAETEKGHGPKLSAGQAQMEVSALKNSKASQFDADNPVPSAPAG